MFLAQVLPRAKMILIAALWACALAQANEIKTINHIVAVVNSEPITDAELQTAVLRVQQQMGADAKNSPPLEMLSRQVLERLINERAQLHFAQQTGLRIEDEVVNTAAMEVVKQNKMDLLTFKTQLALDGSSWERFLAELRRELTLQRLRERDVERSVRFNDAEIDQYLKQKAAEQGARPPLIQIAQLLVAVPESAKADEQQALKLKAQSYLAKAQAGEDFAKLVQTESDADRKNGGSLGLRPEDRYPELFASAVRNLKLGELTLVQSGAGFHVLKLLSRQAPDALQAEVTQTRARHILLRTDKQLTEKDAINKLRDLRRRAAAGEDFAALAKEHSQDGSASEGGDLGWANPGMFVPEFERVMNSLELSAMSQPFVSRFGVHLLQVVDRRKARLSLQEQRDMVRGELREKKSAEAYVRWAQDIRANAYVEYRDALQ
jgi:peptidyl-prolyl cis-trans isomerase SurA